MAIGTDSAQRGPAQTSADSLHDTQITSRVAPRASGAFRDPSARPAVTDRSSARLRAISGSPHDTSTPDRGIPSALDAMRKLSPAEFNTAMAHFYRGEIQR